jgi:hypothetical protein
VNPYAGLDVVTTISINIVTLVIVNIKVATGLTQKTKFKVVLISHDFREENWLLIDRDIQEAD